MGKTRSKSENSKDPHEPLDASEKRLVNLTKHQSVVHTMLDEEIPTIRYRSSEQKENNKYL